MIKFTAFLRRLPSLTREEFIHYHREQHAPLFCELPATRRLVRQYVQSHPTSTSVIFTDFKFDAITDIWFGDMTDLDALFRDPEYLSIIRPDEQKFIDHAASEVMVTRESLIIERR